MIDKDAVWFITGCSKGLERALAEAALAKGYRVAATARRRADLADLLAPRGEAVLGLEDTETRPLSAVPSGRRSVAPAKDDERNGGQAQQFDELSQHRRLI